RLASSSSANSRRGWKGLGTIEATGRRVLSPSPAGRSRYSPRSAPSPFPSRVFRFTAGQRSSLRGRRRRPGGGLGGGPGEDLVRERQVGLRAGGADVVDDDRLAEARRLGETHVAGDRRPVHPAPEVLLRFLRDLPRE